MATKEQYRMIKTKSVRDADGWLTDYTLYEDVANGAYFCMFGDSDIYGPDPDYADWEGDTYEEALEWFDDYTDLDDDVYGAVEEEPYDGEMNEDAGMLQHEQKYSSKNTAVNWKSGRLPALFKKIHWQPNTMVVDYGGGTEQSAALAEAFFAANYPTVDYVWYDKYWQTPKQQNESLRRVKQNGGADVAMLSNVLNVIAEPEVRHDILTHIKSLLKPNGVLYIYGYEGKKEDQEGGGRSTADDQYQTFMRTKDYLAEIHEVFPNATIKSGVITAINDGNSVAASIVSNGDLIFI